MAYQELELGAAGHVLMYRLRYQQRSRRKSLAELSKTMSDLGHPLSPQRIGQVMNGVRRLATDDLTALATALGVPASSLVLDRSPGADTALGSEVRAASSSDLDARIAQATLERDGSETQLYQALSGHEAYGVDEPEAILSRLESLSIRIELLLGERDRRDSEERVAATIAAVDAENEATDAIVLSGALGDKPGEPGYESHKARAEKRATRKKAADGER